MIHLCDVQAPASIQDLGRHGWRCYGIGQSGAMDALALKTGNILLANPEDAPAIELALGGMTLQFTQDTPFCITGALYEAYLDGVAVYSYWRYTAHAGQTLRLVRAVHGMYGYVCVHGGFDVPEVLHSKSTDIKARFGGFNGRYLAQGDRIPIGSGAQFMSRIGIAPITYHNRIHAIASTEYEQFTRKAHYRLWQNPWTLQSDSNRMGYRLKGDELHRHTSEDMLSHAVHFGTIQVPPSGQPIVLMADAQTTGGYPKIAAVARADWGRLAQIRFGGQLSFQRVDLTQAAALQQRNHAYLNQIRHIVRNAG